MVKLKMKCRTCGSENVLRDAWAEWDYERQEWVLNAVFDADYCQDCDGETSIKEEEIDECSAGS